MSADPQACRALTEALAPLPVRLQSVPRLRELQPSPGQGPWVVDYDHLDEPDRQALQELRARHPDLPLVIVSDQECKKRYAELFEARVLVNLIGRAQPFFAEDMRTTVGSLIEGKAAAVDRFFTGPLSAEEVVVVGSAQKSDVLERAEAFARHIGNSPRFPLLLCSVADELFTNSVYNAPRDSQGRTRYAHWPRSRSVDLERQEAVRIRFLRDSRRVGLSVCDPFGALTGDKLLSYLAKGYRGGADQLDRKAGGAGIGLFTVFEAVSHLVVRICPGQFTEMAGLFDVSTSFRSFATNSKSLNLFVQRQAQAA